MSSRYEIDFSLWPEPMRPRRKGVWRRVLASVVIVGVGLAAAASMVLSEITLSATESAGAIVQAARAIVPVRAAATPAIAASDAERPAETENQPEIAAPPPVEARPLTPNAAETVGNAPARMEPAEQKPASASIAELHRQATVKAAEAGNPALKGTVHSEPDPAAAEKKAAQARKRQAAEARRRKQEAVDPTARVYQLPDGRRVIIQNGDRRSYAAGDFRGVYRPVPPAYVGRPFGRPY